MSSLDQDWRRGCSSLHGADTIYAPSDGAFRWVRWVGIVENTPGGRPVIDHLVEPGNVVVATMSSIGFSRSPAIGCAVMELMIEGRRIFADIRALGLTRFKDVPVDLRWQKGWMPTDALEEAGVSARLETLIAPRRN